MSEITFVGFTITKADKQPDGSVIVWGPCTTDDIDSDRQIIDAEFAAKGLAEWLRSGANIRQMHQPIPVGKGVELVRDGNAHFLKSRVVDGNAVNLVTNGVLQAYSVGISNARIVKDAGAPGGRIVGGTFVEVSLVDRPANAACKVDLVEKGEKGEAVWTSIVKDDMSDDDEKCATCKGTGKIRAGKRTCPDCKGSGEMSADVEKKTFDPNVGGGVTRDKIPAATFAGKDRSFPIVTPGDVSDAASSIGRAGADNYSTDKLKANIIAIARRKGKEFVAELPEAWKTEEDEKPVKKGKIPKVDQKVTEAIDDADDAIEDAKDEQAKDNAAHLTDTDTDDKDDTDDDTDDEKDDAKKTYSADYTSKRLHDALCMAYDEATILDAHKTLKQLVDAVDVDYYKTEAEKAFAQGPDAAVPVMHAYSAANRLANVDPAIFAAAHKDLHAAFKATYPNVTLKPTAITPGMFKRPFITEGRSLMHASGKPSMPARKPVPTAEDFHRPLITSGHEAESPMSQTMATTKFEKVEITGAKFVKAIHIETGVAMAGPSKKDAYKALRADLASRGIEIMTYKDRQFYTNNAKDQATSAMQQLHDYICAQHPDICSMKPEVMTDDASDARTSNATPEMMDNHIDAEPMPAAMPMTKAMTTEAAVVEALRKAEKKMMKKTKALEKQLVKAHKKIKTLEKSADVSNPTYRGPRVLPFVPRAMTITHAEEQAALAKAEKADEVAWLRKQVAAGDPESRRHAVEKLQSMLTPDELAEVLVK